MYCKNATHFYFRWLTPSPHIFRFTLFWSIFVLGNCSCKRRAPPLSKTFSSIRFDQYFDGFYFVRLVFLIHRPRHSLQSMSQPLLVETNFQFHPASLLVQSCWRLRILRAICSGKYNQNYIIFHFHNYAVSHRRLTFPFFRIRKIYIDRVVIFVLQWYFPFRLFRRGTSPSH